MSMVASAENTEVMAEINITPFTDVLLVLLIIFMILAALITPPGFQKQLPDTNPNSAPIPFKSNKSIEVLVNDKGRIFVDSTETDVTHIYAEMSAVAKRRGNLHVSLAADVKAPYGIIITILDAAKLSGLNDVGFVTSS